MYRLEHFIVPGTAARVVFGDDSAANVEHLDVATLLVTLARHENILTAQGRPDVARVKARIIEGATELQLAINLPNRARWVSLLAAEGVPVSHGSWTIVLRERTVHLAVGGQTSKASPYATVAQAVDMAVSQVKKDTGEDAATLVAQERLTLRIRGPAREARAAAVQLALHGLVAVDKMLACVDVDASSNDDFYDTFGFSFSKDAVKKAEVAFKDWIEALAKLPNDMRTEPLRNATEKYKLLITDKRKRLEAPLRMSIIGSAGAGKSTFINAVLQRNVASVHTDICTSANTIFAWADRPEHERVEFEWDRKALSEELERTQRNLDKQRPSLIATTQSLLAGENPFHAVSEVAIRANRERREHLLTVRDQLTRFHGKARIDQLPLLTSTQGGGLAEFVSVVTVFLHVPVLQHVQLVDTPGMGDADKGRAGRVKSALSHEGPGEECAIVVIDSSQKEIEARLVELEQARVGDGNRPAVLVLSKIDSIQPDPGSTRAATVSRRAEGYRKPPYNWSGPHVAVSAHSTTHLSPGPWRTPAERTPARKCLQAIVALSGVGAEADEIAADIIRATNEPNALSAIQDYILDGTGVPYAIHELAKVCVPMALRQRISPTLEFLRGDLHHITSSLVQAEHSLVARLDAAKTAGAIDRTRADARSAVDRAWRSFNAVQSAMAALDPLPTTTRAAVVEASNALGKSQQTQAIRALERDFRVKMSGGVSGGTALSSGRVFGGPVLDHAIFEGRKLIAASAATILREAHRIDDPYTQQQLKELCNRKFEPTLTEISPLRERTFYAWEEFFEWFEDTTIPRMRRQASASCDELTNAIGTSLGASAHDHLELILAVLRDHRAGLRRVHEQSQRELKDLDMDLERARRESGHGSVHELESRLESVRRLQAEMRESQRHSLTDLLAASGLSPDP